MELLFLSAHLPSPKAWQAGQKIGYYICEFLARRHRVHLLAFATESELESFRGEGAGIFHCWDAIPVNNSTRLRGVISSSPLPVAIGARNSSAFRRKLRQLFQTHRFDIVLLDHTAMWQYTNDLADVPLRGGIAHDVLSQLWDRRASRATRGVSSWVLRFESKRIREWERQALSKLDFVVSLSTKDDALLAQLEPEIKRLVIQPWVACPANVDPGLESARKPNSVVFWGALNRGENIDAVAFAVREIVPRVREALPDFKFYVAGSRSEAIGSITDSAPNVIRTGFVDNIGGFLADMRVALLPMRQGAGVKVKTLECMAAGVAVVTTPVGAEGIAAAHGVHFLVGETAEELASYTVRLLRKPEDAREMGERARAWFASEYDFGRPMAVLESFLVANARRIAKSEFSGSCTTGVCQDQRNGQYAAAKTIE
jgi:glycosyltransferase involved in cell wall biosynthesis